jgi:hypothetical protein
MQRNLRPTVSEDGSIASAIVCLAEPLSLDGLDPTAAKLATENAAKQVWACLGIDAPTSTYVLSALEDLEGRVVALRVLFRLEA